MTRREIPELKDKNGVQIREGDILEESLGNKKYLWTIKYEFHMSCGCCSTVYGWDLDGWPAHAEVIGNIYDNPELVERMNAQ